jgi:hypothetical protein
MNLLDPYMIVLSLSFLISLSVFYGLKSSDYYLKSFPCFLLVTIVIELFGVYLSLIGKNNIWLYNFFSTAEFCFYGWLISYIIADTGKRKIIRVTMVLYALVAVANILFIQKINAFHSVTYTLGCLVIVACCIYYFFELFKYPKSVKLTRTPAFWICSGLLFYYCCSFSLFGLFNYWSGISKLLVKSFTQIVTILNVFLYSLFAIAFLCTRNRKYILSPS